MHLFWKKWLGLKSLHLSLVWNEMGEKKKSDGPWPTNLSVTNTTQILKKRSVEFTTRLRIKFHSTHSCLMTWFFKEFGFFWHPSQSSYFTERGKDTIIKVIPDCWGFYSSVWFFISSLLHDKGLRRIAYDDSTWKL